MMVRNLELTERNAAAHLRKLGLATDGSGWLRLRVKT